MYVSDLESDFITNTVPLHYDLLHLFLYVFLCGSFHVNVIAITASIVAGDGL